MALSMNDRKEKLQKELEHLEKAHRAGIIDDKEFSKGKERIEHKLIDVEEQIKHGDEQNKVVSEILESPKHNRVEIVDIPDEYGVIVEKEPVTESIVEKEEPIEEEEEQSEPELDDITTPVDDEAKPEKEVKVKHKKLKKKNHRKDDEYEESFSWRPVIAVIAFLIIAAGIFFLIKYTNKAIPQPVEPSFNVITSKNLSIVVEGITIQMDVFADYRCVPCKATRENIQRLKTEFGTNLQVNYRNFPLDSDLNASIAAECARTQSMFDQYADRLYANPTQDPGMLKSYAKDLGLIQKQFNTCIDNQTTKDKVLTDYVSGISRGVKGTPTIFINDKQVSGYQTYEQLKELIQFQLA